MASIINFLNRLLPFATPGTPLLQDILHLAAICAILYFAPQIQNRLQTHQPLRPANEELHLEPQVDEPVAGRDVDHDAGVAHEGLNENVDADEVAELRDDPIGQENNAAHEAPRGALLAEDQPGPAHVPAGQQRNVGAKKAKSLARKDQRRAYHEFVRSQGDAERARDAAGAEEREAALAAERERRRRAERELDAKKAHDRELKRQREEAVWKEEARRRDLAVSIAKEGLEAAKRCNLFTVAKQVGDDVDEEWIEKILNASDMLGMKDRVLTMITGTGWVVSVSKDNMAELYKAAVESDLGDETGRIEHDELGALLEKSLR